MFVVDVCIDLDEHITLLLFAYLLVCNLSIGCK